MAQKVISGPLYSSVSHSFRNLCFTNFSTSLRRYGKKQKDYDLESLIQWNKETALAFGSPLKFTKTGKIRKRNKISDQQLAQNLEVLNILSPSLPDNIGSFDFLEINNSTQSDPRSDKKQSHFSHEDIANYSSEENNREYDNIMNSNLSPTPICEQTTEDEIFIPKIKPVPQHTSNMKVKKKYEESSFPQSNPFNESIQERNYYSFVSPEVNAYKTKVKDMFTEKTLEESNQDFKKLKLETDDSGLTKQPQTSLPIEPPGSFEFITKFPLALDEAKKTHFTVTGLEAFKNDIESLGLKTLPPVKTILSRTMPDLNRFFLNRWREGMIKELGEEGFKRHQDATIKRGINLHANIMELLSGKPSSEIQIMPDNEGHWASIQSAISIIEDVQAVEADVKHPYLMYRGVFDCIARYKDLLCVVDWKTSKKPRPLLKNTYDDPLQIAAYVGAVNATSAMENKMQEINHGLIAVAYPDGSPAHVHLMNRTQCEHYWKDWTDRLFNYFQLIYTGKYG